MDRLSVRRHGNTPTLFINDEPSVCAMLMTTKNLRPDNDGWHADPFAEDFSAAGFRLFSTDNTPFNFDATYDAQTDSFPAERFERLEEYKEYIKRIPDAKFLIRVMCEPRGESSAWIKKHPGECEVMQPEAKPPYMTPSYASEVWLRDAERYFAALGEQIIKRGLADHLFGMLVCCGDSSEWVKIGPMEDWASDFSAPMQKAFSGWLSKKYGDDRALSAAWGRPVSLRNDLIPSASRQSACDLYLFKDPSLRRDAIDHFRFLSELVASDIDRLCAAAKASTNRCHLAGVFYGYLQEMVWNNGFFGQGKPDADTLHSAAARSGHGGLSKVLESENVDFLCSPYCYEFRGIGGEGGFMSPYESVRAAGKLWISEEDTRTHRWRPDSAYGQAVNKEELGEILKRQFSNLLVHSAGAWWCDWATGSFYGPDADKLHPTGSFDEPEIMKLFARYVTLARHALSSPDRSSAAEIAVVIDAESSFWRSTENNFDIPNWRGRAWGISRMGAPVDYVLLSDVLSGRAKKYKMYYMMNVLHLSDSDRKKLESTVRRDGIVTLFVYAPGFSNDERLDSALVEELTEMKVSMRPRRWSCNIFISDFDHEITRKLPTSTFFGTDMQLGPLFSVEPSSARILGTSVSQQGRCEGGFAVKENDGYTTVYSVAPDIPPGVLNGIARLAGVHLYCESEDVFYASREYVMLHTVRSQKKEISLPKKADVYDAFTGKLIAKNTDRVELNMKSRTTTLLYYGDRPFV